MTTSPTADRQYRRKFFSLLTVIVTLSAIPSHSIAQPSAPRKVNILHLHADDHRADGLGALGTKILKTPNLDTLVERGTTFVHAYTMGSTIGAVCLPSRTMLHTGKSWLRIPNGRDTQVDVSQSLAKVLSRAGYETFHVGKGGNEFTAGINAFDTNIVIDDRGEELRRDSSQRHAEATLTYLKTRGSSSKPFYIYIAPPVPHDPRVAPAEFHRLYDPAKIPLPAAFLPQHPWDNGEMAVRDEHLAPWPRTPEDTRQQLADYYATITAFDYQIGRVFAALKASGEWENTIVVFTSDNGLSMGEHGLFGKQNLYEFGGMHVPFVIAGPGIPQGKKSALVYLMDLLPTFAEIAGAPIPPEVEGKSLVAVIQGREDKVRDLLYTGYRDGQRAIRDQRWKLYRYPLVDRTQLFDLANDPHELKNLADDPKHAGKRAELTEKLKTEMARYGDTAPLVVPNPAPAEWTAPPRKPW